MTVPVYPAKPRPADPIAVLSPSSGLPGQFPLPYELGLRRLRDDFGLKVVEYPTTRKLGSTPEERAVDIHAAFADPAIKAVIASDNTNLLLFLRDLGIVSYHGGSVMVEFGRPGAMHPLTADSLRAALFTSGEYELTPSSRSRDVDRSWDDPRTFDSEPEMEPADGWFWHNGDRVVEGISWGGNLEILSWLLMADRVVQPVDAYAGGVLFLETSEELPRAEEVYRILRNMGERSLLQQFPALLMARAKSWSFENPFGPEERARFREQQREAVLRAVGQYAPETMVVFDVDFGHTDPQLVVPVGGRIRVDGPSRRITVTY